MFAGILVFGYVELAFNLCSLALSLCLAVGVNRVSLTPASKPKSDPLSPTVLAYTKIISNYYIDLPLKRTF